MKLFVANKKSIFITASLLMLFAASGAAIVGLTFTQTVDDIRYNEKLTLLKKLNTIIPADRYDNDLLLDTLTIQPHSLLNTKAETLAYRARNKGQNVAVVFSSVAPSGYNGPIQLLIGMYANGQIAGVRVVKHRETPGLGDAVSITYSDWILGFNNRSISNPESRKWKVKRDGGVFDQFTGATITPRAVVNAVHDALLYFEKNQVKLFNQKSNNTKFDTMKSDNVKFDSMK